MVGSVTNSTSSQAQARSGSTSSSPRADLEKQIETKQEQIRESKAPSETSRLSQDIAGLKARLAAQQAAERRAAAYSLPTTPEPMTPAQSLAAARQAEFDADMPEETGSGRVYYI